MTLIGLVPPVASMANQGRNLQKRYLQPNTLSTTNLLSPQSASPLRPVVASAFVRPTPSGSRNVNDSLQASGPFVSVSEKFSLSPDPSSWDTAVDIPEDDDDLHTPDPRRDHQKERDKNIFTCRGVVNLGFLLILFLGILALLCVE